MVRRIWRGKEVGVMGILRVIVIVVACIVVGLVRVIVAVIVDVVESL